jgi:hypothetical protein
VSTRTNLLSTLRGLLTKVTECAVCVLQRSWRLSRAAKMAPHAARAMLVRTALEMSSPMGSRAVQTLRAATFSYDANGLPSVGERGPAHWHFFQGGHIDIAARVVMWSAIAHVNAEHAAAQRAHAVGHPMECWGRIQALIPNAHEYEASFRAHQARGGVFTWHTCMRCTFYPRAKCRGDVLCAPCTPAHWNALTAHALYGAFQRAGICSSRKRHAMELGRLYKRHRPQPACCTGVAQA